ncbi:MAG: hypothetical protein IPJ77_10380 [Planctomycetes bacterium]|nr:hypothetical protein [Planctomycetota bacterium]
MLLLRHSSLALLVLAPFAVPAPHATAQGKPSGKTKEASAPNPGDRVETLDALGLTLRIPAAFGELVPLEDKEKNVQIQAGWHAKLGPSKLDVLLFALPEPEFTFEEPEDVSEFLLEDFREQHDASFAFAQTKLVNGAFGYAPYASIALGPVRGADGATIQGSYAVLAGLLEKHGYSLEIHAEPALDAASEKVVLEFLEKGVTYKGPTRNASWTDAEVQERWAKDAPPDLVKKLEKPVRTKHYVFLSNTGASKQMGDAMEAAYAVIQKTYPFPEVAGRRLMPVFLFRNEEEYHAFYAKAFETTVAEAAQSKGVAARDFYATYYDAPQDPVHIHEMTHQIFANRLRLGGGGSWFQEGVAEYICTRASDRTDAANAVKKERHTKLAEFVKIPSLLGSAQDDKKGDDAAASGYAQAALLIEFLRESKWSKAKFLDWVHAIGLTPDNNLVAIERATKATLGVDLAELEAKWVEYCKKERK